MHKNALKQKVTDNKNVYSLITLYDQTMDKGEGTDLQKYVFDFKIPLNIKCCIKFKMLVLATAAQGEARTGAVCFVGTVFFCCVSCFFVSSPSTHLNKNTVWI